MKTISLKPKPWTVPVALLVLCVISFGVFIPALGFYWDDWPVILTGRLQGAPGFVQFYQYDRPISAWTYILTFPILGSQPAAWHIFTLLLRWLSAVAMWWSLYRLWPAHRREAAWAALLFAVYPVFTQQSISVAYSQHWICYLLYLFSLGCMIQAFRAPRFFRVLTVLSLSASLLHLLTMEYFLGLELLRPLFLWLLFSQTGSVSSGKRQRARKTLLAWLPYLAVLMIFIVWRLFFIHFPGEDRNAPGLLFSLATDPLSSLVRLTQMALQDVLQIVISGWYATLRPAIFDLDTRFSLIALSASLVAALLAVVYLYSLTGEGDSQPGKVDNTQPAGAPLQLILVGGLLTVLGPLPAWFTERQVVVGAYSDRLAIPAMFGAALLIAGLVSWLIRGRGQQIVIISLLIGLAVGSHYRTTNDYRWATIQQNRFFWQLNWRAPGITPETAVFAEAEVLPKTGLYSTAFGINLIYAQPSPANTLPYWFFSLSREFSYRMPELLASSPLEGGLRHLNFKGNTANGIFVYFEPSSADCMRVLTPDDIHDPALSALAVQSLPVSSLSRIQATALSGMLEPDAGIFGAEPEHGWCYLYQKADLARQMGDWEQVAALGDAAAQEEYSLQNDQSNTPQEWIPFIEGFAHTGRWQDASSLTMAVLDKEPRMSERLCDLWQTFDGLPGAAEVRELELKDLNCRARKN